MDQGSTESTSDSRASKLLSFLLLLGLAGWLLSSARGSMSAGRVVLAVLALVAAISLILEGAYCVFHSDRRYELREVWANVAIISLHNLAYGAVHGALAFPVFIVVYRYAPIQLSMDSAPTWIACWFLVDFIYYWEHRLAHRWRPLWALHHVHHSTETMSLMVAGRLSPLEVVHRWTFLLPLAALGFSPLAIYVVKNLQRLHQFFVHTELDPPRLFRTLSSILVLPSDHRVHHDRSARYLNKNFGGVFTIWDRLFGTYEPEGACGEYGVTPPPRSSNPLRLILDPAIDALRFGRQPTHASGTPPIGVERANLDAMDAGHRVVEEPDHLDRAVRVD